AYGYERLAVNFESKSAKRRGALARLESLGSLSGEMLGLLGEDKADPNASAWRLDPTPTDARTAEELAVGLEDGWPRRCCPGWPRTPRRSCDCGNRLGPGPSSPGP